MSIFLTLEEFELLEKVSNYKNLTNIILKEIDKKWDDLLNKKNDSKYKDSTGIYYDFTIGIPDDTDEVLDTIIRVNFVVNAIKNYRLKEEDFYFMSLSDGGWYHKLTTEELITNTEPFEIIINMNNPYYNWNKEEIMGALAHELTHLSQEINKSIQFFDNKGLGSAEYDKGEILHSDSPYEQEANLVALFQILKMEAFGTAGKFIKKYIEYFVHTNFKKFVTKAHSFGVTKEQIEGLKYHISKGKDAKWFKSNARFLYL